MRSQLTTTTSNGIPFRSKETSWLAFNGRVLQEAADPSVPLLERVRFLGIYSSNLDEFFRVRVATLRRLLNLGKTYQKLNIPNPQKTLKEVNHLIKDQTEQFTKAYDRVLKDLRKANIRLITEKEVPEPLQSWVLDYFKTRVRPEMMPIMVKKTSLLGGLRDHPMYLAVQLDKAKKKGRSAHALLEIPSELPRFVVLPENGGGQLVMYIDDIIRFGLPSLFESLPYESFSSYAIKFTRDAEMEFDDDFTESLYEKMSDGLRARQIGNPVRMNYDEAIPRPFLELLTNSLRLSGADTLFPGARYHNRKDLMDFPTLGDPSLRFPPQAPITHHRLVKKGAAKSVLRTIQKHDILLHLPYHSFDVFLDLLREAVIDPLVRSIQITVYRIAKNSCVAKALVSAAHNGKDVTVLIEPRARFDEKANIAWANELQTQGIRVRLGVPG